MAKIALTGQAYQARSVVAANQRCLNLVPEPMPENQTEPMPVGAYPTPGTWLIAILPEAPIRGIRQATNGNIYVVAGGGVYLMNPVTWDKTLLGRITEGLRTPVSMMDNGLDMVIVDGSRNGWTVHLADNAFAQLVDDTGVFVGADKVDYLDTFFIFNKPGTPQFYWSLSLSTAFDPLALSFADKESYPDLLVTLIVAKKTIYLLGERTSEPWYDAAITDPNTGFITSQFAPVQETLIDHGCVAKYSPASYDNTIFWLSRDRAGQGMVMMAANYQAKRISTYAIEHEIAEYARVGRIDDAIGYCYQMGGHAYYVLTFPHADHTWVYDLTTNLWHEWAWIDPNGEEHRHRSNCYCFANGVPLVGDWQNGNLYVLDNDVFTDNAMPIKRVRSFPHMLDDGKRVFHWQFIADIETGTVASVVNGPSVPLDAQFTAPDDTLLEDYTSDVGGGWTAQGGAAATIESDRVVGAGTNVLYQSQAELFAADYSIRYDVVPPTDGVIPPDTSIFVIGRGDARGLLRGYRLVVSTGSGEQYTLTLDVPGATIPITPLSVVMGTISTGIYTVHLHLRGTSIYAQAQRSEDDLWLRQDGVWRTDPGTIALLLVDSNWTEPGATFLGGTWPISGDVLTPTWVPTYETPLPSDPNFPTGYTNQVFKQAFDFTRNWFYQPIDDSTNGGIAVTDLTTMAVLKTATLAQMYAGTPYGHPAGSPPSQTIYDVATGDNTDLYMLMDNGLGAGVGGEFCRFTRVDPDTMTVTGEFYKAASFTDPLSCVMGNLGVVNHTTTNTIVAYLTNAGLHFGPQIMDGTGMQPIGVGAGPAFINADQSHLAVLSGKQLPDGSCDFIMLNSDPVTNGGDIRIWRINVKNLVLPVWQASHVYHLGDTVRTLTGFTPLAFKVTIAGTSGGTEPVWNTTIGALTTDGTVTWAAVSPLAITNTHTGDVLVSAWVSPAWQTVHAYSLGSIVKSSTAGASFVVTTAGTSGSTEPAWNPATGATTSDGTVTWTSLSPPVWQASHAYSLNDIRASSVGDWFRVIIAGTSGIAEPGWNTTVGANTTDGGVTWAAIPATVLTPRPNLYIAQSNYDATNDAVILWISNMSATEGPPVYLMSVEYDGSINWVTSLLNDIGILFSKGQSLLTGSTLVVGGGGDLKLLDTSTGVIIFTGSVFDVSGSYYRIYDASRMSYWTYAIGSFGFTRITFVVPPLAIDNVVVDVVPQPLPMISLEWSDDRGHHFGNPVLQSMGATGRYRTSVQWNRLGMARDRVYRLQWSTSCKTVLQGCWFDATPAQS